MAYHQQKLVHIQEVTSIGASGTQVAATGFRIDDNTSSSDSTAVARQQTTVEVIGADPGANARWWTTALSSTGFTLNWAGFNAAVCDLHIVSCVFHSMQFDISSAQTPY